MGETTVSERLIAAFSAADLDTMRSLLSPGLIAWVTDASGEMVRVNGRDEYLARIEAMDLPAVDFSVDLTQAPVAVDSDCILCMVEVGARRGSRTLHNFAAHLLRLEAGQVAEWWMVDAKPAESDSFWSSRGR